VEDISLDKAQELFSILNPSRFVRASYEANVFDIDVNALVQGWLRAAKRAGAEVLFDAEISRISRGDDGWQVVTTRGSVDAPVVVDAAGAWADDVARLAGVAPLGLKPLRRSMAVVEVPDAVADADRWPFVVAFPLDWYAKPDAGRLLVSPGDEDPVEPHDAFADDLVIAEGLHRFELDVTMPVERVTRTWAGLRTYAPDCHPVVGFDARAPGFFWLAGQGGFGVQTAPALSRLAAALLCGEDAGELDGSVAARVSPARFG
jgi:D-arginine dehydrogenase